MGRPLRNTRAVALGGRYHGGVPPAHPRNQVLILRPWPPAPQPATDDKIMIRVRTWFVPLFLAAALAANGAGAQQRAGVTRQGLDSLTKAVGRRVRLADTSSKRWNVGTLVSVNNETVMLDDRRFPTTSLVAVQRSTGHAYFNPSFAGFIFGALAGGGVGYAIGERNRNPDQHDNGPQRAVGIVLGSAIGGGLGVLVGRRVAPEHWRDILLR